MELDMSKLRKNTYKEYEERSDWYYVDDEEYAEVLLAKMLLLGCESISVTSKATKISARGMLGHIGENVVLWRREQGGSYEEEELKVLQIKPAVYDAILEWHNANKSA